MAGPSGIERAHAVDEWVDVDELVTLARTLVRLGCVGRERAGPREARVAHRAGRARWSGRRDDDGGRTTQPCRAISPCRGSTPTATRRSSARSRVNPADATLFMATNTGLFRIPEGASKPERVVGQLETPDGSGKVSEALVVRFTGPDTLLGSGHPAVGRVAAAGARADPLRGRRQDLDLGVGARQGRLPRDRAVRRHDRRRAVPAAAGARERATAGRTGRRARRRCRSSRSRSTRGTRSAGSAAPSAASSCPTDGGQTWRQRDPIPNVALRVDRGRRPLPDRPGRAGQGQHRRRRELGGRAAPPAASRRR